MTASINRNHTAGRYFARENFEGLGNIEATVNFERNFRRAVRHRELLQHDNSAKLSMSVFI